MRFNGRLYFSNGDELWKSNGSVAGTLKVRTFDRLVGQFSVAGQKLFFTTRNTYPDEPADSIRLWAGDGTSTGTVRVGAFLPSEASGVRLQSLTNLNGTLLFLADEATYGAELWSSNGTKAGTSVLTDMDPSGPIWTGSLATAGGRLFFTAADAAHGEELWTYAPFQVQSHAGANPRRPQ